MAGAAFQVLFEMLGETQGFERRVELDLPRRLFGRVEALAGIMFGQPVLEVGRMTTIKLCWMRNALENVGIVYGVLCS